MKQHQEMAGLTYFSLEKDNLGWKCIVRKDNIIIKSAYGLNGTRAEAETVRFNYVNKFWGLN